MKIRRHFTGISLWWLMVGLAQATEGSPLTLTASVGHGYDSNVLRLPDAVSPSLSTRDDEYMRYTGGIELAVPYKLQKLHANASWDHLDYVQYNDSLNHTNSILSGDWLWQLGKLWSGRAGYSHSHQMTGLENLITPTKEMQTNSNRVISADYQVLPDWTLGVAFNESRVQRGLPELNIYDYEEQREDVNMRYVGSPGNSIGLRVSTNKVDYPNPWQDAGQDVDASYRETMLHATLNWSLSSESQISGNVGYDQVSHQQLTERDFSGITGRLVYAWDISGKTRLETKLWREISPISSISSISNYELIEGVSVAPTWNYSSLLSFQLKVMSELQNYGIGTTSTSSPRKDRVNQTTLTLNYQPIQSALLSVGYDLGTRISNVPDVDYHYHSWSVAARISF